MRGLIWIKSALLVCGLTLNAAAQDAISAYNASKQSQNTQTRIAAAAGLGDFALANPDRADQALLLYEAAQSLCRLDQCPQARPFITQLQNAVALPTSLDSRLIPVLAAYSDWQEKANNRHRKALDAALTPLIETDPNPLTVKVFQHRFVHDIEKEKFSRASKAAEEAARHFASVKDVIGWLWSDAHMGQYIAEFATNPHTSQAIGIAKHEAALYDWHAAMHLESQDGTHADWIDIHRNKAHAWRLAMEAYFESKTTRLKVRNLRAQIDEIVDVSSDLDELDAIDRDRGELPFCRGEFDMKPKIYFPRSMLRKYRAASVLVQIEVTDGIVTDVKTLASVPFEGFKASAEKTVRQWTWSTKDPGAGTTCSLSEKKILLPISYALK